MTENIFLSSFFERANKACENDYRLSQTYDKIRGTMKKFAQHTKVQANDLLMMHIIENTGAIKASFVSFLNSPDQENRKLRTKKYQGEILCRLDQVNEKILGASDSYVKNETEKQKSFFFQDIPEWMIPIFEGLPKNRKYLKKTISEITSPSTDVLTTNSSILFSVFLKLADIHGIQNIESLFADFRNEILNELKKSFFGAKLSKLRICLDNITQKLGVIRKPRTLRYLPINNWPDKLRDQWESYKELVTNNKLTRSSTLKRIASQKGIKIKEITETTLEDYERNLGIGLYHCQPFPENIGVENLIALEIRHISIAGFQTYERYNQYVDRYKDYDTNRLSKLKEVGFISSGFNSFKYALIAIATFNGFSGLVKPFSDVYNLQLDQESTKKRKDRKSRLYTVKEIDEELARLEIDFNIAVKNRSYKFIENTNRRTAFESMNLCTFFPLFVFLRYVGVRQRNIRNFRVMLNPENPQDPQGNIGLKKDGTLVIHYGGGEIKNKKPIHLEFNLIDHEATHGQLIRIMTTYLKKIYPYVAAHADTPAEGEAFALLKSGHNTFSRFTNTPGSFTNLFLRRVEKLLQFPKLTAGNYEPLTPHFLRHTCAYWLRKSLKLTFDQMGEYLADNPDTLRRHYADSFYVHDATHIITQKNREMSAARKERDELIKQNITEENKD